MRHHLGSLGGAVALLAVGVFSLASPASSVVGTSDLSVTKTGPASVTVGSDVTYTIEVTNEGPDPAEQVTLTDELPPGMILAEAESSQGTCIGEATVVCSLGTIEPSKTVTVTITATPTVAGDATNEATVTSSSVDPDPSDNTDSLTTEVNGSSCTIIGTQGDDILLGGPAGDVICGLGGDDEIDAAGGKNTVYAGSGGDEVTAGAGNDLFDGSTGLDLVSYRDAGAGVDVDLAQDEATGWGADDLPAIERAAGSPQKDVLRGASGANLLTGGGGTDLLFGRKGPDDLSGGPDDDYLSGGLGADTLDGGGGTDACASGKRTSCLSTSPSDGNDSRGKLDVKKVKTSFGSKPAWRVVSRGAWSTSAMWDTGYVLVFLDTLGGEAPDYYAMARSTGTGMKGHLYRIKGGIDTAKGTVTATRPNASTVRVTMSLGKVEVGPAREFYRWSVQTLTIGPCAKVCFDLVPAGGGLVQPL